MPRKAASGAGTIRKKTVIRAGKEYTYWEARYTAGTDPGTGKQIQRSVTGKTQKEVSQKLREATKSIDDGTYKEPCKLTVGEWLEIWSKEYLGSVKPRTVESYKGHIKKHLKPAFGAVKLEALAAHTIQSFYNALGTEKNLSPKTVKNVHGVLHKALQQAVAIGYIRVNPADACALPRVEKKAIAPMDASEIRTFMKAIEGHRFKDVFLVTLFTGMRRGEVLGLQWDCVDFERGTLRIDKQLQQVPGEKGNYLLFSTKNSKGRSITPASAVMDILRKHRAAQNAWKLKAGTAWEETGFVFTDGLGHHLSPHTVYHNYKRVVESIGLPEARFHDLRHSYAVAALQSGDDIKSVQENLGHHTAAFTLDVYGHVTEQMKRESAARMDQFIQSVSK